MVSPAERAALEELFKSVRGASTARNWSRGVEMARAGHVFGAEQDEDSVSLKVTDPKLRIAPVATLYVEDAEWDCSCGGDDPCAHVAAATIALKRAREEGQALPEPPRNLGELVYRLKTLPERAEPGEQVLLIRVKRVGDQETLVDGSIAALLKNDSGAQALDIEQADLQLDRALSGRPNGTLPPDFFQGLLRSLAEVKHLELNGKPCRASGDSIAPRARVEATKAGFRVTIERHPDVLAVVLPGVALVRDGEGAVLKSLRGTELTGKRLQNLPSTREYPKAKSAELITTILPALREKMDVDVLTDELPQAARHLRPRAEVQITQEGGSISAFAVLVYGDPPVARIDNDELVILGGAVPVRDTGEEKQVADRLREDLGLIPGRRQHFHAEAATEFATRLDRYRARAGRVTGDAPERFLRKASLSPQLSISGSDFSLEFSGTADDGKAVSADANAVLKAWQQGLDLVPLSDGGFAPLPADFLSQHGHRVLMLLSAKEQKDELAAYAKPQLLQLCRDLDYPAPPELAALAPLVDGFEGLPEAKLPKTLNATLRHYQEAGVSWLGFLRQAGLGGVLADDMGLGKTLQALASLPEVTTKQRKRTLVVCPTSVLMNWRREANKFRPDLTVCVYHGAKRELDKQADLVLTSYALLRLDRDALAAETWNTLILDEAQTIKNPDSQVAQAAFSIPAEFRLSLSGTPVENRLDELWSQLHFSNPGLLGGRADFDNRFAKPIAEGQSGAAQRLRSRIAPFLLRRLKRDVAPELPPRTDVTLYVELTDTERATYDAVRAATEKELASQLGAGSSVLAALEALLRLRQACCHPALLPGHSGSPADTPPSSKVTLLVDHLERAAAENHKSLVFSQWTSLLDLVEPALRGAGLDFVRLDGSTANRDAVVQTFQAESGPPVMLISLKAGGTGLNLTAADHVFLLDPWWNPAVEDQAADRAHRIGQERPVIVHRMVAEDSVEERILALQEQKRAIADAALGEADKALSLTREDLLGLLG
ncbi:MAG: DEAD/DEAH box helicase [Polyangiaceae bacterium]|nr:DEAD/DEAH box helicase [Polyangiaceae bacterium]